MRLSIGRARPASRSLRASSTKAIVSACVGICSACICASGVSSETTGLPRSRARPASTRSMAYDGSKPSRRAASTVSEATWNSGANVPRPRRRRTRPRARCSRRRSSAGGSGSARGASRCWRRGAAGSSGSRTSSSSATVSLPRIASTIVGPGNIQSCARGVDRPVEVRAAPVLADAPEEAVVAGLAHAALDALGGVRRRLRRAGRALVGGAARASATAPRRAAAGPARSARPRPALRPAEQRCARRSRAARLTGAGPRRGLPDDPRRAQVDAQDAGPLLPVQAAEHVHAEQRIAVRPGSATTRSRSARTPPSQGDVGPRRCRRRPRRRPCSPAPCPRSRARARAPARPESRCRWRRCRPGSRRPAVDRAGPVVVAVAAAADLDHVAVGAKRASPARAGTTGSRGRRPRRRSSQSVTILKLLRQLVVAHRAGSAASQRRDLLVDRAEDALPSAPFISIRIVSP